MKPYRVKRAGKYIGSWIVVHGGARVNLGTKDANEARRRAALLARGQWPDQGAAAAVKEAIESLPAKPDEAPPAAPPPVAPPSPPASPQAVPSPAPPPDPAAAPGAPTAADAVNAAARAEAEAEEAMTGEAKAAVEAMGIDFGEIEAKLPEGIGRATVWATGQASRGIVWFLAGKLPPLQPVPEEAKPALPVLGRLVTWKLGRWGVAIEQLTPGWWLAILLAAAVAVQTVAGLAHLQAEKEKEEAPKIN
jgi:hypothetical protein